MEKNLQDYRARLENCSQDEIISVTPEIGVPIAEKLSYVCDKQLSDLYISLLATASKKNTVSQAHPSFVNVINNLSPDEAKMLEHFVLEQDIEYVTAIWNGTNVYSIANDLIVPEDFSSNLLFPSNISAYFNNLVGLGIVSIFPDRSVHESQVYEKVESYWREKLTPDLAPEPGRTLSFKRGVISTTTFGRQFINACHSK